MFSPILFTYYLFPVWYVHVQDHHWCAFIWYRFALFPIFHCLVHHDDQIMFGEKKMHTESPLMHIRSQAGRPPVKSNLIVVLVWQPVTLSRPLTARVPTWRSRWGGYHRGFRALFFPNKVQATAQICCVLHPLVSDVLRPGARAQQWHSCFVIVLARINYQGALKAGISSSQSAPSYTCLLPARAQSQAHSRRNKSLSGE